MADVQKFDDLDDDHFDEEEDNLHPQPPSTVRLTQPTTTNTRSGRRRNSSM